MHVIEDKNNKKKPENELKPKRKSSGNFKKIRTKLKDKTKNNKQNVIKLKLTNVFFIIIHIYLFVCFYLTYFGIIPTAFITLCDSLYNA